jgi:hypothetical protein
MRLGGSSVRTDTEHLSTQDVGGRLELSQGVGEENDTLSRSGGCAE